MAAVRSLPCAQCRCGLCGARMGVMAMRRNGWFGVLVAVVVLAPMTRAAIADPATPAAEQQRATEDALWTAGLRAQYFQERPIVESDEVIALDTPERAENAALVPIGIHAQFAQSEARSIRTIW